MSATLSAPPAPPPAGGARELLVLAAPLILSTSFHTIQILIDRMFLSAAGKDAVGAAMATVGYFWTPLALLNNTVLYSTVFVAQYSGAGRPHRIGPVVWQALYFALLGGLLFPLLTPLVGGFIEHATAHDPAQKHLELVYFRALTWAALPMLLVAACCGFFAGRGASWTVLAINAVGAGTNVALAFPLIRANAHDPAAAMAGAGYAAALGSAAAAAVGLLLLFRPRYRAEFHTLSGWRFDPALFRRLMRFGLPNGVQWMIEALSFTAFILLIGNIGGPELAATSLTFTLNLLTFLPVAGLGQGVEILVGRRQGEGSPDAAAKTTYTGAVIATGYMTFVAILYCTIPNVLTLPFAAEMAADEWAAVGPLIPGLLMFVAAYSLADGANVIFAYALRGAGDTRFVTLVAIGTAWPIMVLPTYLAWKAGWGMYAGWGFATVYVVAMAAVFGLRFRGGAWRSIRVIEAAVDDTEPTYTGAGGPDGESR